MVEVFEDFFLLKDYSPSVASAGGSFSQNGADVFEDFGGTGDGSGVDTESFGDLPVGEVDEALAESHGFSSEKRKEGCSGRIGEGFDESGDGMGDLGELDEGSRVLHWKKYPKFISAKRN